MFVPEMNGEAIRVREDHVVITVGVEINESEPSIRSGRIGQHDTFGQSVVGLLPGLVLRHPVFDDVSAVKAG